MYNTIQHKNKQYDDEKRHAKRIDTKVEDVVLVKQTKKNKFSTQFTTNPLFVTEVTGS